VDSRLIDQIQISRGRGPPKVDGQMFHRQPPAVDVSSNEITAVRIEQPTQSTPAPAVYTYTDYGSPVTVTAPKI
jgi:hypothetical protein